MTIIGGLENLDGVFAGAGSSNPKEIMLQSLL